jgi:hypothetical protein
MFSPGDDLLVVGFGFAIRFVNTSRRARGGSDCTFTIPTDTFLFAINTGALKYAGYPA